MKAFLVGFLAVLVVTVLTGLGFLLFPFLLVLGWVMRIVLMVVLVILAIWLLGRFILYIWGKLK